MCWVNLETICISLGTLSVKTRQNTDTLQTQRWFLAWPEPARNGTDRRKCTRHLHLGRNFLDGHHLFIHFGRYKGELFEQVGDTVWSGLLNLTKWRCVFPEDGAPRHFYNHVTEWLNENFQTNGLTVKALLIGRQDHRTWRPWTFVAEVLWKRDYVLGRSHLFRN